MLWVNTCLKMGKCITLDTSGRQVMCWCYAFYNERRMLDPEMVWNLDNLQHNATDTLD